VGFLKDFKDAFIVMMGSSLAPLLEPLRFRRVEDGSLVVFGGGCGPLRSSHRKLSGSCLRATAPAFGRVPGFPASRLAHRPPARPAFGAGFPQALRPLVPGLFAAGSSALIWNCAVVITCFVVFLHISIITCQYLSIPAHDR